jgi:hypothetical protein
VNGLHANNEPVWFEEIDRFDPVAYVQAQYVAYALGISLTWKTVLDDADSLETSLLDGILEPFSIRVLPSFWSGGTPNDTHKVRGAFMDGNEDTTTASDFVQTVYVYDVNVEQVPFTDKTLLVDGTIVMNGNFRSDRAVKQAFIDARYVGNVSSSYNRSSVMTEALSLMSGSTENYVNYKERSATCGWEYDRNGAVGTDSLSFGGMTY